jgi:hypothetical protein
MEAMNRDSEGPDGGPKLRRALPDRTLRTRRRTVTPHTWRAEPTRATSIAVDVVNVRLPQSSFQWSEQIGVSGRWPERAQEDTRSRS